MKVCLMIISSVIAISFYSCQAQGLFNATKVKAANTTFLVKGLDDPAAKYISVTNVNNALSGKKMTVDPTRLSNINLKDPRGYQNSLLNTFSKGRLKELLLEESIMVIFYVNPDGKILETGFVLNKNTSITPKELEKLEISLKHHIAFILDPEEAKGGNFFPVSKVIRFSEAIE